jgi:hypothetical protein
MSENGKKNDVLEDLKNIGLVLGGVVIGKLIDVGTHKILKLEEDASLSGLAEMKKFISPAVRIVGGGAGAYFVPNKIGRLLLGGVAVSGASSMVNYGMHKVLNKSAQVSGFGEIDYTNTRSGSSLLLDDIDPDLPDLAIEGAGDINLLEQNDDYSSINDDFDDAEIM